jgi:hypothetical protein
MPGIVVLAARVRARAEGARGKTRRAGQAATCGVSTPRTDLQGPVRDRAGVWGIKEEDKVTLNRDDPLVREIICKYQKMIYPHIFFPLGYDPDSRSGRGPAAGPPQLRGGGAWPSQETTWNMAGEEG